MFAATASAPAALAAALAQLALAPEPATLLLRSASSSDLSFGRADTISSAFAKQQQTIAEEEGEELDTSAASAVASANTSRQGSLAPGAAQQSPAAGPHTITAASAPLGSVNSITTPSLAAAIVQRASLTPRLSLLTQAPQAALEDAAAFAAQVIRPTATDLLLPAGAAATATPPAATPAPAAPATPTTTTTANNKQQQLPLAAAQWDENDLAEVVIVAEPESASVGSLHPRGSLYERPVNADVAKAQHAKFRQVLSEHGVKVLTVREILAYNVEDRLGARLELEALAAAALTYTLAPGTDKSTLTEADLFHLSDAYKAEVVSAMSTNQLIEICLINPTVTLSPTFRDTGLTASYAFEPLTNLVFTRDQQITTGKGVVMARLRSQQRQKEVALMQYCWQKLGINIAGGIEAPGYLEGGDFFPLASRDLSLVGIGLRSNMDACRQLMDRDLLGTNRLAVVRDDFDRNQDRMHLDCVFSILGDSSCIMLETIMGEASATRRLVDEYARDGPGGKYVLVREGVELSAYIRGEGFSIIPISHEHQLAYACNVLNLGRGRIISVHAPSARQILSDPGFKGDVQVIDFGSVTSMYGSVHCASQVVRRTTPALARLQHPSAARALAAAAAKSLATSAAAAATVAANKAKAARCASAALPAPAVQQQQQRRRLALPDALKPIAPPKAGAGRVYVSAFDSDDIAARENGGGAGSQQGLVDFSFSAAVPGVASKAPSSAAGCAVSAAAAVKRSYSSFVFSSAAGPVVGLAVSEHKQ